VLIIACCTGVEIPVKTMWMLAIAVKSLVQAIKTHDADNIAALFAPVFVQSVSYLAMHGTRFSQHWIVSDLEVTHLFILLSCFVLPIILASLRSLTSECY